MNTGQELKADPTINAALEEIYTQADDLRNYAGKLAYEGCLNLLRKPAVADDIEPQQVTRVDTLFAKTKVILAVLGDLRQTLYDISAEIKRL